MFENFNLEGIANPFQKTIENIKNPFGQQSNGIVPVVLDKAQNGASLLPQVQGGGAMTTTPQLPINPAIMSAQPQGQGQNPLLSNQQPVKMGWQDGLSKLLIGMGTSGGRNTQEKIQGGLLGLGNYQNNLNQYNTYKPMMDKMGINSQYLNPKYNMMGQFDAQGVIGTALKNKQLDMRNAYNQMRGDYWQNKSLLGMQNLQHKQNYDYAKLELARIDSLVNQKYKAWQASNGDKKLGLELQKLQQQKLELQEKANYHAGMINAKNYNTDSWSNMGTQSPKPFVPMQVPGITQNTPTPKPASDISEVADW